MPTDQDEADELFGGGSAAAPPPPPLAGKPPSADNRKETRVRANWQARVLLPSDRVVELNVFDLSESGVGLISEVGIPAHTVLQVALAVPGLHDPTRITPVTGTIKTTYVVVKGNDLFCGGMWVSLPADARDLLDKWIRRLRK